MLPAQWHSLILGEYVGKVLEGGISSLARLIVACLPHEALHVIQVAHKVVVATSLQLEGLVGGRVEYRSIM
jgi:hypothetical protein